MRHTYSWDRFMYTDRFFWCRMAFVAAVIATIVGGSIWFLSTHHCERWITHQCTEVSCSIHSGDNCIVWSTRTYDCTECAGWVPDAKPIVPEEAP